MKILYVTTIGMTMGFFKMFIKELIDEGNTVDIATNENISKVPDFYRGLNCKIYNISCTRSPLDFANIKAIKEIKKIVSENGYDMVHCHTPIAAMCTRLACRNLRKNGLKVFYTAHGFHFYKGAPLANWMIFYPIEKLCSHYTDVLITINKEDYSLAKRKMKATKIEYIPGVGLDVTKFLSITVDKNGKRKELGIPEDAIVLISVGEVNINKNHQIIVKAMAQMSNPDLFYVVAGDGPEKTNVEKLAVDLGLKDRVKLLGQRSDVGELYKMADIFCFPSLREGLGLASLEAMACGLPIVTSNVHGINDYSEDKVTGYKFSPKDLDGVVCAIENVLNSDLDVLSENCIAVSKRYDKSGIIASLKEIYQSAI